MYMADYMVLEPISGMIVDENEIIANAKVTYLIELYMIGASSNRQVNNISNNVLYGEGTSVYGIAAYVGKYLNITNNDITTIVI
ncbi:hypothetical protein ALNOE001_12300 [Candidatus Methanobinarius endosymbioticus]|uniref:Uncharacterized protein n=1 Tax=Candidatus Methanobinarius endosymbioticus TaxID=2006182 RepID=A0A366MAW8_9EURY|nr:hypothetical protein ALNOE001_12300 [Candidatus Methanobinarius endosymbioticus]